MSRWDALVLNGDERKYDKWELKFLAYLQIRKLKATILRDMDGAPPDDVAADTEKMKHDLLN